MRVLFVTLCVVLGDQATKLFIKGFSIPALGIQVKGMPLGSTIPIVGDFARLTYIENPGMAFGIDVGGKLFFSLFSVVASIGILLYLYKMKNERLLFRFSLALILGGAIGNLIDRVFYGVMFNEGSLFYGKVVDFIDIDFFNVNILGYHLSRWPIFNVADSSVTIGVLILLLFHRSFVREDEENEQHALESSSAQTPPEIGS